MGVHRIVMAVVALTASAALAALAGCTSATDGSGTTGATTRTSAGSTRPGATGGINGPTDIEGGSSAAPPVSLPPSQPSQAQPSGRALTFTGSSTGTTYHATVYDSDDVTNCAAHAYGQKMITFLTQNPCRGAHRVIATLVLAGRTVAVSIISTSFASPDPKAPFAVAAKFTALENAECSCGMSDLLREGGVLPGVSGGIPPSEAFTVLGQDTGVTILDAWYIVGATKDQDRTLVAFEHDVFLSELANA